MNTRVLPIIYGLLVTAMLAAGAGLLLRSQRYPWFIGSEKDLYALSSRLLQEPRNDRFDTWYVERKKLETPRKKLNDMGEGVVALGLALGCLALGTRFPLPQARSPKTKLRFYLLYLAALAAQLPLSIYYLAERQARHDYPSWGDSIAIGMIQDVSATIFFAVVGSGLWALFLRKARFPAPLWSWPPQERRFNLIVTAGTVLFAGLGIQSLVYSIPDGGMGDVLLSVVNVYLFLSLRAGLVKYQVEATDMQR